MKNIVIIGASYLQQPLIDKAKDLGFTTHVFAWQCGDIGEKTADHFYPISIIEKEAILAKCREIRPDCVCTISTDLGAVTANYVANALGLPANPPETAVLAANKYEMRKALSEAGLGCPAFEAVREGERTDRIQRLRFPLIVKPTDRSGSRGVRKIASPEELEEAVRQACAFSFEKRAIAEEFIEGREYSCEAASYHGEHRLIAVTKKYTTGAPSFIEIGHIQPPDLTEEQLALVEQTVYRALDALHITDGISHSELKIDDRDEIKIVEIGARMGGGCIGSHLVRLSTGVDFVKAAIDISLGQKPELTKTERKPAGIRFIMSRKELAKLESIQRDCPQLLVEQNVELDRIDEEVTDDSTRHGYFILSGNDREQIRSALDLD